MATVGLASGGRGSLLSESARAPRRRRMRSATDGTVRASRSRQAKSDLSRPRHLSAASPSHPGLVFSSPVLMGFLGSRRNHHITVPLEKRIMAKTNTTTANLTVKIIANDKANPPGKLADAELHFGDGILSGLKLIGFAVWERRTGDGRNVTFPARTYSVNGERRSFALLRPTTDASSQERVRDLILGAYAEFEAAALAETA